MDENTYFMRDQNRDVELSRLIAQSQAVGSALGDCVPPGIDPESLHRVLDVGSGPGVWCMQVAEAFPSIQAVGIEYNEYMVQYSWANSRQFQNVYFQAMNVLNMPLAFDNGAFDLVHSRFSASFLSHDVWPAFLQECRRLLRSGGYLNCVEMDLGITNSASWGQLLQWLAQVTASRGFGQGFSLGTVAVLPMLMRQAGFSSLQMRAYPLDSSTGTPHHDLLVQDGLTVFSAMRPAIVGALGIKGEQFDAVYEQATQDCQRDDFCQLGFLLSVVGIAP